MSKQDKKIKKAKKAKVQADQIVAEAVTKVKDRAPDKYDSERKEGVSEEDYLLGVRVRELRDQGEPWWAIARDLELPGFGTSATTGKKGAAKARAFYKTAFGDFPRTFKRGAYKGPIERNEAVAALKKHKKSDMRERALGGKPVIDPEMSDEDLAGMLKGRHIKWIIRGEVCPEGMEMEAYINAKTPFYVFEIHGDRVIEFRERDPRAPVAWKLFPGITRTVRVDRIFSVK